MSGPVTWLTLEHFARMVLIRRFEEECERQYKLARIGGYCHLSSGQEAATVASVAALDDGDILVTGYRCHGFALARGVPAGAVMAELFGRRDGCARGRGGSMHLLDPALGYFGGWGIVAGQLPIATGLALALTREGRDQAVMCELGDGAVNMGAWHESLNLAALWRLPVVFLVVNNVFGMGTAVERASAEPELWRRACAYRMPAEQVDGADFAGVAEAAARLMADARAMRVPALLELTTYRFRGHSVADPGTSYRTLEEIEAQRARDPLTLAREQLEASGTEARDLDAADQEAAEAVEQAVSFALESPEPPVEELAAGMHAPGSGEQFERMCPGSPFGEKQLVFAGGLGR